MWDSYLVFGSVAIDEFETRIVCRGRRAPRGAHFDLLVLVLYFRRHPEAKNGLICGLDHKMLIFWQSSGEVHQNKSDRQQTCVSCSFCTRARGP